MKKNFYRLKVLSSLLLLLLLVIGCNEAGSDFEADARTPSIRGILDLETLSSGSTVSAGLAEGDVVFAVAMDMGERQFRGAVDKDGNFSITVPGNRPYLLYFYREDAAGTRAYLGVVAFFERAMRRRFFAVGSSDLDLGLVRLELNEQGITVGTPSMGLTAPVFNPDTDPDRKFNRAESLETTGDSILLPAPGYLSFTLAQADTAVETDLYLVGPGDTLLFDGRQLTGIVLDQKFLPHQEVRLSLEVDGSIMGLGAETYSSLSEYARITSKSCTEWVIGFETLPWFLANWDYDDLVVEMTLTGITDCDYDGDGVDNCSCDGTDCDDSNADVYPDAPELCDHIRNQCKGDANYSQYIDQGCYLPDLRMATGGGWYHHMCALLPGGSVKCWGRNHNGSLGNGSWADSYTASLVIGISDAVAISIGRYHSCAVLDGGSIKCWGYNAHGELGMGSADVLAQAVPVDVWGISDARAVFAGKSHSCALRLGGEIVCWGDNRLGQLGRNPEEIGGSFSIVPVKPEEIDFAHTMALEGDRSCALMEGGIVKCWGYNQYGELGDDTDFYSYTPVNVTGIEHAIALTSGRDHGCALIRDGSIKCWGRNSGRLGNYTDQDAFNTAVPVIGISNAIALDAGDDHTCAMLSDRSMKCWGSNYYGQLGNGQNRYGSIIPVEVSVISNVDLLGVQDRASCALLFDGTIECWGGIISDSRPYRGSIFPIPVPGFP